MKFIVLLLIAFFTIQTSIASSGNGITSSGLEKYAPYGYFAWFLGSSKIPVCLQVDEKFPIKENVLKDLILAHVDLWRRKYKEVTDFASIPERAKIDFNFEIQDKCDDEARLQFIFGIENDFIQRLKLAHKSPRGFATLLEFDSEKYLGKGIIWIEGPKKNDEVFVSIKIEATLLHELGHVFGVPHVEGTIMTANDINLGSEASLQSTGMINIYMPHSKEDLLKFYSPYMKIYDKEKFDSFIAREIRRLENDEKIRNRVIKIDQESIMGFNPKQNTRIDGRIPSRAIYQELKMGPKENAQDVLDFLKITKDKIKNDQKAELFVVTNLKIPQAGKDIKEDKSWIDYHLTIEGSTTEFVFRPNVLSFIDFQNEKLFSALVLNKSKEAEVLPWAFRIKDYFVPNSTTEIYGKICNRENKCFQAYFYINKNNQCSLDILTEGTPVTIFTSDAIEKLTNIQTKWISKFDSHFGEKNEDEDWDLGWEDEEE